MSETNGEAKPPKVIDKMSLHLRRVRLVKAIKQLAEARVAGLEAKAAVLERRVRNKGALLAEDWFFYTFGVELKKVDVLEEETEVAWPQC